MKWDAAESPSVPGDLLTATYRQPGVVLTDRHFTVPLDHDDPAGETIELYAREVVASDKADRELPWLLYLQGGPGFGATRFVGRAAWLGRALEEYRVLLLDQRGTGHSTPANRQTLPLRGGAAEQADYLTRFRADSIVRDCEAIRPEVTGGAPWTVLGQSFMEVQDQIALFYWIRLGSGLVVVISALMFVWAVLLPGRQRSPEALAFAQPAE